MKTHIYEDLKQYIYYFIINGKNKTKRVEYEKLNEADESQSEISCFSEAECLNMQQNCVYKYYFL